ncbi:hypothetical protein JCM21142_52336 [Saccharicrinis fermentans DSM 9555 = JCM 21142]|uniref:Lcl C-terminal domain-containing protein n=2 Tax=Saccharicrinis fermentans TaxID=982 RepID=W7Y669_9BACT|nr:hypothetical protein JCM21142_52336 [Saccharicrinis fermentans DSM 9555 = JCM 21142]
MKIKTMDRLGKIGLLFLGVFFVTACSFLKHKEKKDIITNKEAANYVQIATGQLSSYGVDGELMNGVKAGDALFGQDGYYLKGQVMSYRKNGDGTVSDLNSNLMWQEIPTEEGFDWQGAKDYCENLKLGGYDDWRLPSAKELFSITDFNAGWPYIDLNYFSLVDNVHIDKSEQYWSSNKYVGHTEEGGFNAAFGVNFATGHIKAYPAAAPSNRRQGKHRPGGTPPPPANETGRLKGTSSSNEQGPRNGTPPPPVANGRPQGNPMLKHVRAVRGDVYGLNNFVDNGDSTITDISSGLMWSKNDSEMGLNWPDALAYAENSDLAGYRDWRLPNIKELQGIVEYNYAPGAKDPKLDRPAINPVFHCSEIINENGDKDYPYFWSSTSARFQKGKPYYYAWYVSFGRAVNKNGLDFHGAGAVRFDTKHENGPAGEGGERFYNYVRLVRELHSK